MTEELLSLASELQQITKYLIEEGTTVKTKFQTILMALLRKNHYALYSLVFLSNDEYTGDAVLDLSRRMLEDMISLTYMKTRGKDKMADQFINFLPIESKHDLDFAKSFSRLSYKSEAIKIVEEEFEEVKKEFTFSKGDLSKSWAKCNVEQMLEYLLKKKVFDKTTTDITLQGYIFGNRKNHLSPKDLVSFIIPNSRSSNLVVSTNLGLLLGLVTCAQIAKDYCEELDHQEGLEKIEELSIKIKQL